MEKSFFQSTGLIQLPTHKLFDGDSSSSSELAKHTDSRVFRLEKLPDRLSRDSFSVTHLHPEFVLRHTGLLQPVADANHHGVFRVIHASSLYAIDKEGQGQQQKGKNSAYDPLTMLLDCLYYIDTQGAAAGLFEKLLHYFNYKKEEYLQHYHKRSSVESTCSAIKRKFGSDVRIRQSGGTTSHSTTSRANLVTGVPRSRWPRLLRWSVDCKTLSKS